jgi:hypothetical protein
MSAFIGCETAAIDRWIEPCFEPVWICRKCAHPYEMHDSGGCFELLIEPDGFCECGGFE